MTSTKVILEQYPLDLVLDLDGVALSFRSLLVEGGGEASRRPAMLVLQLDACVRKFPSLDINF